MSLALNYPLMINVISYEIILQKLLNSLEFYFLAIDTVGRFIQ